jgi:hypothetical protein
MFAPVYICKTFGDGNLGNLPEILSKFTEPGYSLGTDSSFSDQEVCAGTKIRNHGNDQQPGQSHTRGRAVHNDPNGDPDNQEHLKKSQYSERAERIFHNGDLIVNTTKCKRLCHDDPKIKVQNGCPIWHYLNLTNSTKS